MPELPEVEITRRGITPALINQNIADVTIRHVDLRWRIPDGLDQLLIGQRIEVITRRAKYLLLKCTQGFLIIHLGMSGSLRILFDSTNVGNMIILILLRAMAQCCVTEILDVLEQSYGAIPRK